LYLDKNLINFFEFHKYLLVPLLVFFQLPLTAYLIV
jgi:hypothetical protein